MKRAAALLLSALVLAGCRSSGPMADMFSNPAARRVPPPPTGSMGQPALANGYYSGPPATLGPAYPAVPNPQGTQLPAYNGAGAAPALPANPSFPTVPGGQSYPALPGGQSLPAFRGSQVLPGAPGSGSALPTGSGVQPPPPSAGLVAAAGPATIPAAAGASSLAASGQWLPAGTRPSASSPGAAASPVAVGDSGWQSLAANAPPALAAHSGASLAAHTEPAFSPPVRTAAAGSGSSPYGESPLRIVELTGSPAAVAAVSGSPGHDASTVEPARFRPPTGLIEISTQSAAAVPSSGPSAGYSSAASGPLPVRGFRPLDAVP